MRNKFAGICFRCGKEVKSGQGFFQSRGSLSKNQKAKLVYGGRWLVRCSRCVNTGNEVTFG